MNGAAELIPNGAMARRANGLLGFALQRVAEKVRQEDSFWWAELDLHDAAIVDQMRKRVIELEQGHVVRDQSRGVYGYAR